MDSYKLGMVVTVEAELFTVVAVSLAKSINNSLEIKVETG